MKITNPKKFEKTVKRLANFCKPHKDKKARPFDNKIFAMGDKFYATNGHFMAIVNISDCVEGIELSNKAGYPFSFPIDIKAAETIEFKDDNSLIADGKEIDFEQAYVNIARVIPDGKPSAELSLDFSGHGWDIGFGKGASVYIGKDEVIFDYADECECQYITRNCYADNGLLDGDYGDFQTIRLNLGYMKEILKISDKIKILQYEQGKMDSRKIIAGDYEIVIVPMNYK